MASICFFCRRRQISQLSYIRWYQEHVTQTVEVSDVTQILNTDRLITRWKSTFQHYLQTQSVYGVGMAMQHQQCCSRLLTRSSSLRQAHTYINNYSVLLAQSFTWFQRHLALCNALQYGIEKSFCRFFCYKTCKQAKKSTNKKLRTLYYL